MQDITLKTVIAEIPVESVEAGQYDMPPSAVWEEFAGNWRKMVSRWSVNRTVAEVQGLSCLSAAPLNSERVARTLNASLMETEDRVGSAYILFAAITRSITN